MKTLSTPAMKDIFSRRVTAAVSLHLRPRRSTEDFMRERYFSSCSSAVGTRFRHSITARCFALIPVDLIRSCCLLTIPFCAVMALCHCSSRCGMARFPTRSNTVSLSSGGYASQSSALGLALLKETFLDSWGVGGEELFELRLLPG